MSSVAAILTTNASSEATAQAKRAALNVVGFQRSLRSGVSTHGVMGKSERRERRVDFGPAEVSNRADRGLRARRVLSSRETARLAVGPRNIFAKTHTFQCTAVGRLEAARGFPFCEASLRR